MEPDNSLRLTDLCRELGLQDHFVLGIAASSQESQRYHSYRRPKKRGGSRLIDSSQGSLKRLQRLILDVVLSKYTLPPHVHGCIKGRSITTNAADHVAKAVVVNIDLTEFFATVTFERVKAIFETKFQFDSETATILARITTYRECLPTGAPSSPMLANLAALEMDTAILDVCTESLPREQFGYSRYVDDITISGDNAIVELLPAIYQAIENSGFKRNTSKTRILRSSTRQWVTGVVVNRKVNAPRKVVRNIRQALFYCKKWGIKEHCETHGYNIYRFMRKIMGQVAFLRLTQPDLADYFSAEFKELWILQDPNPEKENVIGILELLKRFVDNEEIAYFVYNEMRVSAAPAEITVDFDGTLVLRAFEFQPNQRWETYTVSEISDLTSIAPRLD